MMMNSFTKRLIAGLLAFMMVVGNVPSTILGSNRSVVFAESIENTTESENVSQEGTTEISVPEKSTEAVVPTEEKKEASASEKSEASASEKSEASADIAPAEDNTPAKTGENQETTTESVSESQHLSEETIYVTDPENESEKNDSSIDETDVSIDAPDESNGDFSGENSENLISDSENMSENSESIPTENVENGSEEKQTEVQTGGVLIVNL